MSSAWHHVNLPFIRPKEPRKEAFLDSDLLPSNWLTVSPGRLCLEHSKGQISFLAVKRWYRLGREAQMSSQVPED